MLTHLNIEIFGRVQGVSFRAYAKKCAEKLGIKGFVRNQDDDSIYIEAEGEEKDLKKFISWCETGPGYAEVEEIKTEAGEMKNYSEFEIKY